MENSATRGSQCAAPAGQIGELAVGLPGGLPHELAHLHTPLAQLPPAATLTAAGELLRALSSPVRMGIVLQLNVSQRCVHELVEALGVTQPLISQHLRVLKTAGVVRGERTGREVMYSLVDDHLSHIVVDAIAHATEVPGI